MKISLIGPVTPYRGGIAHFTTLLAKQLIDAGHNVQVISFKKQYPKWLYPGESDKDFSPGRETVEAEHLLSPLNPFTWSKTVLAIKAFQPDEVILPWWVTFWGPAFRNVSKRLKDKGFQITYLIHNTIPHEARAFDKWLARRTLAQADRFIVMTHKEKKRLLELLPLTKNIKVTPHPIYPSGKSITLTKEEARVRLGLPREKLILLFFGFIRPYKGLSDLLKSLKKLLSIDQKIHLVIAGEFWHDRKTYEQQINSLGLAQHVHLFDHYIPENEVSLYFEAADLFVAPYTGGTQSGALKTALGFGLPAVITDVISDEFIIDETKQCKIVPSGDPDSLAKGILEMINKPKLEKQHRDAMYKDSWRGLIEIIESYQTTQLK